MLTATDLYRPNRLNEQSLQRRLWEAEISSSAHPVWILPPAGVSRNRSTREEMTLSVFYCENGDEFIPSKTSTATTSNIHDTKGDNRQAPSPWYCSAARGASSKMNTQSSMEQGRTSDVPVKPRIERAQSLSSAKLLFDEAHAHHNKSSGRSGHGSEFSHSGKIFRYPYSARWRKKVSFRNVCGGRGSSAGEKTLRKSASSPYPYKLDVEEKADEVHSDTTDIGHEYCPEAFADFQSHSNNGDNHDYHNNNNTSHYGHSQETSPGAIVDSSAENRTSNSTREPIEHSAGSRTRTATPTRARGPLSGSTWLGPEVSSPSCRRHGGYSKPQSVITFKAPAWPALNKSSGRWSGKAGTCTRPQASSGSGDGRHGVRENSRRKQQCHSQARNRAFVLHGSPNCGTHSDADRENGTAEVSPRSQECPNERDDDCNMSESIWHSSCKLEAQSLRSGQVRV